jgi:hypothetical protein
MTKSNTQTTEKRLENILSKALIDKKAYITAYDEYLRLFISEYDTSLNKNSQPLLRLFKALDESEKVKIRLWLIKYTSLDGCEITSKGAKIRLKEGYNTLQVFEGAPLWTSIKIEVKPIEYTDEKLKKSLSNLLKHYSKDLITDILTTL